MLYRHSGIMLLVKKPRRSISKLISGSIRNRTLMSNTHPQLHTGRVDNNLRKILTSMSIIVYL